MKIVCISDTHLRNGFSVPDGDVLIHAGDATLTGSVREVAEFARWFGSLSHKRKIFIAGNHDWLFQKSPELARSMLDGVCEYLEDRMIEIDGVTFYGSPWQPRFMDWAFNLDRKDIAQKWALIPAVDVLITHGPPWGVLDYVKVGEAHLGCKELCEAVGRTKPRAHIFGHIHGGYGQWKVNGIQFVNASICDEAYKPTNAPITIELSAINGDATKTK